MNRFTIWRYFYYAVTLLAGEPVYFYLKKARKFQYQSRSEIQQAQLSKLRALVAHALRNSLFYADIYRRAGIDLESIQSLSDLTRLPFVTKADLAGRLSDLSARGFNLLDTKKTTGGSTGQAVSLYKNPMALACERAVTARSYEWAGIQVGSSQARFWGVPLSDINRLRYRMVDFIANRARFSAFAVTERSLEGYYNKIARMRPVYIYGYVSAIVEFARFVGSNHLRLPDSLKAVITTSEVLTPHCRKEVSDLLCLPVFNEYGCGEVGSIAHECDSGSMHLMEDNLIVEIVNQDGVPSDSGEIVITDLTNFATPLIRYRLGDFATEGGGCVCGRTLRTLENIHGRAYDQLITADGRRFHPEIVMYIFEKIKDEYGGIKQFQVIQLAPDQLSVFIVKDCTYSANVERVLESELMARIAADIKISFSYVNSIAREGSGKMRLVKSLVRGPV